MVTSLSACSFWIGLIKLKHKRYKGSNMNRNDDKTKKVALKSKIQLHTIYSVHIKMPNRYQFEPWQKNENCCAISRIIIHSSWNICGTVQLLLWSQVDGNTSNSRHCHSDCLLYVFKTRSSAYPTLTVNGISWFEFWINT